MLPQRATPMVGGTYEPGRAAVVQPQRQPWKLSRSAGSSALRGTGERRELTSGACRVAGCPAGSALGGSTLQAEGERAGVGVGAKHARMSTPRCAWHWTAASRGRQATAGCSPSCPAPTRVLWPPHRLRCNLLQPTTAHAQRSLLLLRRTPAGEGLRMPAVQALRSLSRRRLAQCGGWVVSGAVPLSRRGRQLGTATVSGMPPHPVGGTGTGTQTRGPRGARQRGAPFCA